MNQEELDFSERYFRALKINLNRRNIRQIADPDRKKIDFLKCCRAIQSYFAVEQQYDCEFEIKDKVATFIISHKGVPVEN